MEIGCTYHCNFILNSNIEFYKDLFYLVSLTEITGLQCGLMPYLLYTKDDISYNMQKMYT